MITKELLEKMQNAKAYKIIRCGMIGDYYPGAVNLDLQLVNTKLHICFDIDQKYIPDGISADCFLHASQLRYILYAIEHDLTYNEALKSRTENVKPIRRGRWVDWSMFGESLYKCSECNAEMKFKTNFCPRCGAQMKGDEE